MFEATAAEKAAACGLPSACLSQVRRVRISLSLGRAAAEASVGVLENNVADARKVLL